MTEIIEPYLGEAARLALMAVIAWFTKGKMQQAVTKSKEADALKGMQDAYKQYVIDNRLEMDEMKQKIAGLHSEIDRIEKYWKTKYNTLKKEFANYKNKTI